MASKARDVFSINLRESKAPLSNEETTQEFDFTDAQIAEIFAGD